MDLTFSDATAPLFFVIDSESLPTVESRLYGFLFRESGFVDAVESLGTVEPSGCGAYTLVRRTGGRIEIRQDSSGCHGLYLYRDGGFFALANSFALLLEHVETTRAVTLNLDYARALLASSVCPTNHADTLAREIEWLDRGATITIDIAAKSLRVDRPDLREATVDPDTEEGIGLLDAWHARWTAFIRDAVSSGHPVAASLSGGFDTRMVFPLLIGSGIDLGTTFIHSMRGDHHTLPEDFAIASTIADVYGFTLNDRRYSPETRGFRTIRDILDGSLYAKMGTHKQMYFKRMRHVAPFFTLAGIGGECLRGEPETDTAIWLGRSEAEAGRLPAAEIPAFVASIRAVFARSIHLVRRTLDGLGRPPDPVALANFLYRDSTRSHFGKTLLEASSAGQVYCCPLLDPEVLRIRPRSGDVGDPRLLMAVILSRYEPRLIEFKVQGGRSIPAGTLERAREINARFPPPRGLGESAGAAGSSWPRRESAPRAVRPRTARVIPEEVDAIVLDAFRSARVRDAVERVFGRVIYEHLDQDTRTRAYFPLEAAHAAIAVARVVEATDRRGGAPSGTPAVFLERCRTGA